MGIFELWLIFTLIPSLADWLVVFAVVLTIAMAALFLVYTFILAEGDSDKDNLKPIMKKVARALMVVIPLVIVIPDTQQMKYIIGGYVVTNADGISELPDNLVGAANEFLSDYTKKEDSNE